MFVDVLAWGKDKEGEGREKGQEGEKGVERERKGQKQRYADTQGKR